MKRGFTLLEILIVIIIIAVLATLAFNQYTLTVEKSRGAEIKTVFGHLRGMCAANFMEEGDTDNCTSAGMNIGTVGDQIPGPTAADCRGTHFFWYTSTVTGNDGHDVTFEATRCITGSNGKATWPDANAVLLVVDYDEGGSDVWTNPVPPSTLKY
jgi:prepilin-type N-terminal cleavage/methylation domain-containing protein